MSNSAQDNAVRLQAILYNSSNPTRRWLHLSRHQRIIDAIRRNAGDDNQYAAEVGPGSGVYLPELCGSFENVIAIDIDGAHIDNLRHMEKQFSNLRLQQADVMTIEWRRKLDLLLCSEVIEHVPNPAGFLAHLSRALKPGGLLVLSTPQPWSILELSCKLALSPQLINLTRRIYGEPVLPTGHISVLSRKRILNLLSNNNFDVVSSEMFGLYLPILAEFGGDTAVRLEAIGERLLNFAGLTSPLWTQLHIARKRPT